MLFLRLLFGLPLVAGIACGLAFLGTRDLRWLRRGLWWTGGAVLAALLLLGGLFLEGTLRLH